MALKVLFLTEIDPFPPVGGEKIRTYGLLKLMSGIGLQVSAITGRTDDFLMRRNDFDGITFYSYDFEKDHLGSRLERYMNLFRPSRELLDYIEEIMDQDPVDVAYIDYHLYGQYIRYFKKRNIPVIYGTHNAQARLIYQNPAESFRNRITRFTDYLVNRLHESWYFRKADALIVVSEEDRRYHRLFFRNRRIYTIPNFLVDEEYKINDIKKENYIIMSGNLKAFQNRYGLEWFVREVWDDQLAAITQLVLAGLGSKELLKDLADRYTCRNISAVGRVDDLKPMIAKAQVSIVPLLHGSGSRLKCIESMALKTQLISTSKGAEGIMHENSIAIADHAQDFHDKLLELLENPMARTETAHQMYLKHYSLLPNAMIFKEILQTLSLTNQVKE